MSAVLDVILIQRRSTAALMRSPSSVKIAMKNEKCNHLHTDCQHLFHKSLLHHLGVTSAVYQIEQKDLKLWWESGLFELLPFPKLLCVSKTFIETQLVACFNQKKRVGFTWSHLSTFLTIWLCSSSMISWGWMTLGLNLVNRDKFQRLDSYWRLNFRAEMFWMLHSDSQWDLVSVVLASAALFSLTFGF